MKPMDGLIGTIQMEWFDPGEAPPPFDVKLLLMMSGFRTNDGGKTYENYTEIITAHVTTRGPCDRYDRRPAFEEYMEDDPSTFLKYQFYLKDERGRATDWYSDAIVAWAHYP